MFFCREKNGIEKIDVKKPWMDTNVYGLIQPGLFCWKGFAACAPDLYQAFL